MGRGLQRTLALLLTGALLASCGGKKEDNELERLSGSAVEAHYKGVEYEPYDTSVSQEEIQARIDSFVDSHALYVEITDRDDVRDGDIANIDYTGYMDGEAFENGSDKGYDLTIGSGSFIDDFEQQLIGHKPGENVSVEVTFPDDYDGEDVAGKDAVFAVTINSISVTPELTDAFVAENITEEGVTTAEEYRNFVKNKFYEQHLKEYLTNYIIENTTVKSYPSDYLKKVRATTKYNDESMLQYFSSYGMTNVWDLRDDSVKDELSYEKELRTRAKETAKNAMVYQAIFEDAGLTLDMEAVFAEMTEESGEEYVANMKENYGEGYLAQGEIREAVTDYLMELNK